MAKAGFTISIMLNVASESKDTMLGDLAQAMMPWNSTLGSDAVQAQNYCNEAATSGNGQYGVLLQALGNVFDCAVRIARTDVQQGSDVNDTTCSTPGPNTGTLSPNDITSDTTLGTGPGMCSTDVLQCKVDLASIQGTNALNQANLSNIAGAINLIPSGITQGATVGLIRVGLRAAISN